jgi:hypothetical protein
MNKRMLIATAVSVFAATSFASTSFAAGVKCGASNACKGQSACKTASSACKGQNACKGQGFTEAADAKDCTAKGGKVM